MNITIEKYYDKFETDEELIKDNNSYYIVFRDEVNDKIYLNNEINYIIKINYMEVAEKYNAYVSLEDIFFKLKKDAIDCKMELRRLGI